MLGLRVKCSSKLGEGRHPTKAQHLRDQRLRFGNRNLLLAKAPSCSPIGTFVDLLTKCRTPKPFLVSDGFAVEQLLVMYEASLLTCPQHARSRWRNLAVSILGGVTVSPRDSDRILPAGLAIRPPGPKPSVPTPTATRVVATVNQQDC